MKDREMYYLEDNCNNAESRFVSLTKEQADVIKWLSDETFADVTITKISDIHPDTP